MFEYVRNYYGECDMAMISSVGGFKQLENSDCLYVATPEDEFCELVHTGVQATLRAAPGGGFVAPKSGFLTTETASSDYADLPPDIQRNYEISAVALGVYLRILRGTKQPVEAAVLQDGMEHVHRGMLHDRYDTGCDIEEQQGFCAAIEAQDPQQKKVQGTVVNMGFLALRRPDIFPWVAGSYGRSEPATDEYIQQDVGIQMAVDRAEGAIRRVVLKTGHQTDLQAELLNGLRS